MLGIYECAACVLAVVVFAALLYSVCVMYIVTVEAAGVVARTSQELTLGAAKMLGRWMVVQPREP